MSGVKGKSGGKRAGAGRKPAPVLPPSNPVATDDPAVYLTRVMQGLEPVDRGRIDAAKALLIRSRSAPAGAKKLAQSVVADAASKGRFAPSAPPRLIINNRN